MPLSSWLPIYEVLTRHGVRSHVAMATAKNELRNWELQDIKAVLDRVKRPSRDYCYFRDPSTTQCPPDASFKRRKQRGTQTTSSQWISPPRAIIEQSARDEAALCINQQGQWSLRTSGYVALSHVWIEGLQRDQRHNGVDSQKVDAVFALLHSRNVQADWIWTDVLVIPGGDSLEDEMLKTAIINTMPQVYSRADAVIVIDAMVLQLYDQSELDVAVGLCCGSWATRVWTYQEIKLASHAIILTATRSYVYRSVVDTLKKLETQDEAKYHGLWLRIATMMKGKPKIGQSYYHSFSSSAQEYSHDDVNQSDAAMSKF